MAGAVQVKTESITESQSLPDLSAKLVDELEELRRSKPVEAISVCDAHLGRVEQSLAELPANAKLQSIRGSLLLIRGTAHYNLIELDQAKDDLEASLELFRQLGNEKETARSLINLGLTVKAGGNLSLAMEYFHRGLDISRSCGFTRGVMSVHLNIGNIYFDLGDFPSALEHYQQSHVINKDVGHQLIECSQLSNIGQVYRELKQYDRAIEHFQRSLAILVECNDKRRQVRLHSNMVGVYNLMGRLDEARKHAETAWELAQEVDSPMGLVFSLGALADIEVMEKHFDKALMLLEQALTSAREIQMTKGIVDSLVEIGRVRMARDEFEEARLSFYEALSVAEKFELPSAVMRVHEMLADYHERTGAANKALHHFRLFHKAERAIINEETTRRTMALQTWHASEQSIKEAEIHRLKSVELVKANQQLRKVNREKNEFLSIAAHDLKNQLSAIVLACSVVHKAPERFTEQELHRQINSIGVTAEHMREIILNLLDVNRLENGKLDIYSAAFNLCSTLQSVTDNYTQRAAAKNINIHVQCPEGDIYVFADRDLCKEAVENLLSNAIKFSPLGKNVYLRAWRHGDNVRIAVQDEGPGFKPEDRNDLFGKFSRLSAKPTANEHSTGLGLWIVKKLIDAMGGSVWCDSVPGNGATFTIELPAA